MSVSLVSFGIGELLTELEAGQDRPVCPGVPEAEGRLANQAACTNRPVSHQRRLERRPVYSPAHV